MLKRAFGGLWAVAFIVLVLPVLAPIAIVGVAMLGGIMAVLWSVTWLIVLGLLL